MSQVQLCPDVQSPELSIPCPASPANPPRQGGGQLPFTGSAWIDLLIGIAVGMILVGLVWWYYSRQSGDKPSISWESLE